MGSSRWPLKVRLHLSISTALMRPRRPKQYCLQLDIALWCKNQIEHSIWDESLLFSNCARSLEYSSSSTLAGLSYHICGKPKEPMVTSKRSFEDFFSHVESLLNNSEFHPDRFILYCAFDGAETCELVGCYLLSILTDKYGQSIGLYRDDGLVAFNKTPKEIDQFRYFKIQP